MLVKRYVHAYLLVNTCLFSVVYMLFFVLLGVIEEELSFVVDVSPGNSTYYIPKVDDQFKPYVGQVQKLNHELLESSKQLPSVKLSKIVIYKSMQVFSNIPSTTCNTFCFQPSTHI